MTTLISQEETTGGSGGSDTPLTEDTPIEDTPTETPDEETPEEDEEEEE